MTRTARLPLAVATLAVLTCALPGSAAAPSTGPYDGRLPFHCQVQRLGTGTDFPHPEADPFCVDYDKTHQNVDHLGVVDFLLHEPARFAAVSDKCFYYQRDHWRSALVQGDEATELYNWDGAYWYDKSTGAGGAFVEHFTVNNRSANPQAMPGFPSQYKKYFGYGRGGWQASSAVPVDPSCADTRH